MLEVHNVSKTYGQVQVLSPTNLQLAPGETTVLLGPSGCGKSTLLRIIVGLVRPDTGHVSLDGVVLDKGNILSARHRMGYMIQDGGLFPHLTLRGNVSLLAQYLGWDKPRIEGRLEELLDLVHLPADAVDRFPREISGGQRQRVSLMRALFLDPDLLLLDEPLGALDPLIRSELQTDLHEIFKRLKKTVVVVTHDIGEAGFLADSIALLKSGQIVQRGTLEQLLRQPADEFVTRFINAQRSPLESLAEG